MESNRPDPVTIAAMASVTLIVIAYIFSPFLYRKYGSVLCVKDEPRIEILLPPDADSCLETFSDSGSIFTFDGRVYPLDKFDSVSSLVTALESNGVKVQVRVKRHE